MNFKYLESHQKLNGCYYTPSWLAEFISRWVSMEGAVSIMEPSCGDGAFFDALSAVTDRRDFMITGFEIDSIVADAARYKLAETGLVGDIIAGDFIQWAIDNHNEDNPMTFDAVVGNPPFIRYQYLEKEIQNNAQYLFELLDIKFTKHTNAWIPFILASIEFLEPGGKLGMVVPAELLHVLYGKELRKYLLDSCSRILLIDPEDLWFEGTLQGVMVMMAEKKDDAQNPSYGISIIQTRGRDFSNGDPQEMFDNANYTNGTYLQNKWTYALLTDEEREIYQSILQSEHVYSFSRLADVDVGIVTGANSFFLVPNNIVEQYGLHDVSYPMFGRSEHCPGIIYDEAQHLENGEKGLPTNFLYFETVEAEVQFGDYLMMGTQQGLPSRYKCRIRKPWFKVPSVYSSPISMLKRSNGMPRLILNSANAYTTDTAYRITPKEDIDSPNLVCGFLNTVTALSAELEGRHYGGGVLELVPSEIERLAVPYTATKFADISELNNYVKTHTIDEVLHLQDQRLFPAIGIELDAINTLRDALVRLKNRRQRNGLEAE